MIAVKVIFICISFNSQIQGRWSIVLHQNPEMLILDLSFEQLAFFFIMFRGEHALVFHADMSFL